MEYKLRGRSDATSHEETKLILKLANATSKDIFCDLGCGNGNVCRWTSKKVDHVYGVEDYPKRYRTAISRIKKYRCNNVEILNEKYSKISTLKKLRNVTIFYCVNAETIGFFKKFQEIMPNNVRFVTLFPPPYPIKPKTYDKWFYLLTTPFELAKNKKEWIKSVTKKKTLSGLISELKQEGGYSEEDIIELEEDLKGIDWIRNNKK